MFSRLRKRLCVAVALGLAGLAATAESQDENSASCGRDFSYQMKKTIMKIDVLELRLRIDGDAADAAVAAAQSGDRSRELDEQIAQRYLDAASAESTIEFRRSISYKQFTGGDRKALDRMVKYGLFDEATAESLADLNASRFSFLKEREIEKGDKIHNVLRGDSLFESYVRADGTIEFDDVQVGSQHRLALLGNYFAPKTEFRDGLLDALWRCVPGSSD